MNEYYATVSKFAAFSVVHGPSFRSQVKPESAERKSPAIKFIRRALVGGKEQSPLKLWATLPQADMLFHMK